MNSSAYILSLILGLLTASGCTHYEIYGDDAQITVQKKAMILSNQVDATAETDVITPAAPAPAEAPEPVPLENP